MIAVACAFCRETFGWTADGDYVHEGQGADLLYTALALDPSPMARAIGVRPVLARKAAYRVRVCVEASGCSLDGGVDLVVTALGTCAICGAFELPRITDDCPTCRGGREPVGAGCPTCGGEGRVEIR